MTIGLRESKRLALRNSLSLTTVLLARERGLSNVRVVDIVNRVGVSRRTFGNYFSSKEDAIADRHVLRTHAAADALLIRPAGEPIWTAVTHVILEPYNTESEHTSPSQSERDELLQILSDPEMQSAVDRGARAATATLGAAIARRIGVSTTTDPRPCLVANAALSTLLTTLEHWLGLEEPQPLLSQLSESFRQLGAGLDHTL